MKVKKFFLTPWKLGRGLLYGLCEPDTNAPEGMSYWIGLRILDANLRDIGAHKARITEELYMALHKEAKANFTTYAAAVSSKDRGWKP